jgi:putative SOS response-associated peptidase YedK
VVARKLRGTSRGLGPRALLAEARSARQAALQHDQRTHRDDPHGAYISRAVQDEAVPATGWYEWQKLDAKKKRPIHMCAKATPFALAGVYDVWKGDGGKAITSFAIVTTEAAPSVAQYHNRMPVVLDDSQFDGWVRDTPDQAAALMKPYAGAIEAWEVGAEVGNVRNNQPELMERVGLL